MLIDVPLLNSCNHSLTSLKWAKSMPAECIISVAIPFAIKRLAAYRGLAIGKRPYAQ